MADEKYSIEHAFGLRPGESRLVTVDGKEYQLHISKGPSCYGFYENGMVHEVVMDEDGKVIEEKQTPFHEWNKI